MTRTVQLAGSGQDGAPEVRADGVDRRNRIWPAFQGEAGDEQRAGESGRTAGDDASHCRQGGKVRDRKAELPVADAEILQGARAGEELNDEVPLPVGRHRIGCEIALCGRIQDGPVSGKAGAVARAFGLAIFRDPRDGATLVRTRRSQRDETGTSIRDQISPRLAQRLGDDGAAGGRQLGRLRQRDRHIAIDRRGNAEGTVGRDAAHAADLRRQGDERRGADHRSSREVGHFSCPGPRFGSTARSPPTHPRTSSPARLPAGRLRTSDRVPRSGAAW